MSSSSKKTSFTKQIFGGGSVSGLNLQKQKS